MSSQNVIFVRVPKVAGMSIYRVLLAHGCPPRLWDTPSQPFANSRVATFGHLSLSALIEHGTPKGPKNPEGNISGGGYSRVEREI